MSVYAGDRDAYRGQPRVQLEGDRQRAPRFDIRIPQRELAAQRPFQRQGTRGHTHRLERFTNRGRVEITHVAPELELQQLTYDAPRHAILEPDRAVRVDRDAEHAVVDRPIARRNGLRLR